MSVYLSVSDLTSPIVLDLDDLYLSDSSISVFSSDEESGPVTRKPSRSDSEATDEDSWHKEAVISLRTALEKNHPVEVAGLELNSLRMAADASWHQVRRATATAFIARLNDLVEQKQTATTACGQVIARWAPLLSRMIHDQNDQVDFLFLIQKECSLKARGGIILLQFAHKLYDVDLITEEAINSWWDDERSVKGVEMANVRKPTQQFITWLAEADEEDDEDDDEGEED